MITEIYQWIKDSPMCFNVANYLTTATEVTKIIGKQGLTNFICILKKLVSYIKVHS